MAVQNAILGYWRHAIAAIVVVLAAVFAYGQYDAWKVGVQQDQARQVAEAEAALQRTLAQRVDPETRKLMAQSSWNVQIAMSRIQQMPPEQQMALVGAPSFGRLMSVAYGDSEAVARELVNADPLAVTLYLVGDLDDATRAEVKAGADQLATIGANGKGAAAAEAWIEAAELQRVLGDAAARKSSLEQALPHAQGAIAHGIRLALAAIAADGGDVDGAIAMLRASESDPADRFVAQDAAFQIGRLLESAGRGSEAQAQYDSFLTRWPDAPMAADVKARQAPASPAGAPVPAPAAP